MIAAVAAGAFAGMVVMQAATILLGGRKKRERRARGYADLSAHRSYQYPERQP